MDDKPTGAVAGFVAELDFDHLPAAVRTRTHALVLDSLACALLGRVGPDTAKIEGLADWLAGPGDSTVVGSSTPSSLAGACLTNSYQITALNVCDVYRPAHCHLSPVVVAPALAVGEALEVSGRQLLTAVAAGYETASRVGAALDFDVFRERGWHAPGVIGPFGGAAAAGRLHELDADAMRNALGLAGSQSGGTMAQWGSPTIKFHQSRGALSGLIAAALAAQGYRAGEDVLASPVGGILETFSGGGSPAQLTDELGARWELLDISLKRWPSGSGLQTMVSSLFALIESHAPAAADVERVRVTLPSAAHRSHGDMGWDDRFKAMLSARYIAAVVLFDRRCWVEQFSDERTRDPELGSFARDRVEVEEDAGLSESATVTEIHLTDGSVLRDERDRPHGDPSDPLDLAEVEQKFRDASMSVGFDADSVLGELLALESIANVAPVLRRFRVDDSIRAQR